MAGGKRPPFEGSRWDDDRGVKDGSAADRKRDTGERRKMRAAERKPKGKPRGKK